MILSMNVSVPFGERVTCFDPERSQKVVDSAEIQKSGGVLKE